MKCRVCKSTELTSILNLGEQYLSEFRKDQSKPLKFPLELVFCRKCNQVQLKETIPQNLLYTDNYGYRSGINNTMRRHLSELVDEITEVADLGMGDLVVDIGSNDATLLKYYNNHLKRVGFDLVPKFAEYYKDTGIKFHNEPFNPELLKRKAKVITCISMFYDLDNPVQFIGQLKECLADKGVIVIQQNYLVEMIKNNAYDNVVFEHICYHSLSSLQRILDYYGLEVFKVEVNDLNGGSIRTYICRVGDYPIAEDVFYYLAKEIDFGLNGLKVYEDFAERVKGQALHLHITLTRIKDQGMSCYLYAASTRINTVLQYAELEGLIQKAVERNPEKVGKFVSSIGLPIISEQQARLEKPDYMLVGSFFFREEIIKRESEYIANGGYLLFPLPNVEAYGLN
jgi:NDP-4-keto-2,6-dideoxyhexose 3-C-methyltransferase